jgi:1-aminocyclopropane-1-carboxylate deaminase/D-cysteine desulfhydrase-like pyridoxal-dependent ACC family enzyme
VPLGHFPTPLEELPRFSRALGGPRIWIKRDDCTGLAFGGNKTRHNEFIFGYALERGVDMLVWGAGEQSNNCRQTAAACARLGLGCHLVLSHTDRSDRPQGNLLLDYILGASVEFRRLPLGPELFAEVGRVAERYRAAGRKVLGGDDAEVKVRAAISYVVAMAELADQCRSLGIGPDAVYFSSAGATAAGVFVGRKLLGLGCPTRSVAPLVWPWNMEAAIADTGNLAAARLDLDAGLRADEIDCTTDYVAPGYGRASPAGMEATRQLAQSEGILLDPIYTAKAMAALIADVRAGRYRPNQNVVFLHTGGTPVLFAFHEEMTREFRPQATAANY